MDPTYNTIDWIPLFSWLGRWLLPRLSKQQFCWKPPSPRWSPYTTYWYTWVSTIHSFIPSRINEEAMSLLSIMCTFRSSKSALRKVLFLGQKRTIFGTLPLLCFWETRFLGARNCTIATGTEKLPSRRIVHEGIPYLKKEVVVGNINITPLRNVILTHERP